jgi:hypothetical protein
MRHATLISSATSVGTQIRLALLLAPLLACSGAPPGPADPTVARAEPPSSEERYCAWFGDVRGGVLYFGQAAFWSAYRASGETGGGGEDPRADLAVAGPQLIGRFDLERGELLPPLEVGGADARSGVWDVHAHSNGRVYFTTYFESMGWVDPRSGEVRRLEALGPYLNEIAPGPGANLLVSRYAAAAGAGSGSIVLITPEGELLAEHPLEPPQGFVAAPKTPAFDPARGEIWATMDLLPEDSGPIRHDTYVLGLDGRERRRIERPEIQFVAFGADGTGYRAEREENRLWLHVAPPGAAGIRLLLDDAFAADLDFAQDIQIARDGRAVVTRWSGFVHVVDPHAATQTLRLPALEPGGLYYSGVLAGERVCATYCADVSIVCQRLP